MEPRLGDLIDLGRVREMVEACHRASGMPHGMVETGTGNILAGAGWPDICARFHLVDPETPAHCLESRCLVASGAAPGRTREQECPHGLRGVGIPILVAGHHLATMFLGPFLRSGEAPGRDPSPAEAVRRGFERDEYLAALARVPVLDDEKVDAILACGKALAGLMASLAEGSLRSNREGRLRRKAESELQEAQRLAMVGGWEYDPATGVFFWTGEVFRIFGRHPLQGEPTWAAQLEAIHPDDRAAAGRAFRAALEDGSPFGLECRVSQPGGRTVWVWMSGRAEKDASGKVVKLAGTMQDVSARRESEMALARERSFIRQVIDTSPNLVFVKDAAGRFVLVNQAVARLFQTTPEAMIGRHNSEFLVQPGEIHQYEQVERQVLAEGRSVTVEEAHRRADGSTVWFLTTKSLLAMPDGTRLLLGISSDVTERRQAEEQLRISEELFRRTFDLSPIGAAMVGLDFRFMRVNQELCRLTGYAPEELTVRSFPDITHPDDLELDVRQAGELLAGRIDQYQMEKRYLRKDGRVIWIRLSVRLVRGPLGQPLFYLPMMEDIDESRRTLEAIRQSEKALGQQNRRLEELNTALRVLTEHHARERAAVAEKLVSGIKTLVLPYLEMLKERGRHPDTDTLVEILEKNISEITAPMSATLPDPFAGLTPTEIRVADLVRRGKSSKEIAALLGVSPRAVSFHRNNIRRKMGITSRKGNLRATLISQSKPLNDS